jgi:ABC-2 type transport system ATP-binding protein
MHYAETYTKAEGMTATAIEAEGLVKRYGDHRVLDGVDLDVRRGGVLALLGPNGAGKTTTVRILATLLRPDAGRARVAGLDVAGEVAEVRRRIGLTGQYAAVDELQTGEENLRMMARLAGLRPRAARVRARELLARFGLAEAGGRRAGTYSGGMRRRLDLAASLVVTPEVLFLDEPTTGLDPRSRRALWDAIGELVAAGVTILLTTQYLEEADRLADRVAVLDRGRVVAQGTPEELKRRVAEQRLELVARDDRAFDLLTARLDGRAVAHERGERRIGVASDGSAAHVRELLDAVDPDGAAVERFALRTATLDDVFLALTGHHTEESRDA